MTIGDPKEVALKGAAWRVEVREGRERVAFLYGRTPEEAAARALVVQNVLHNACNGDEGTTP